MKLQFASGLERNHKVKLLLCEIEDYFETSSEDYDALRLARKRLESPGSLFENRRFTFKIGKGILTVKRIADFKPEDNE